MAMTDQLQQLWQLAFGDDPEFIRLYFTTAYSPERCCHLTDNGLVTAALHWLDCEYRGRKLAYIYAVATHPDHRGKGLCRRLMEQTHRVLTAQGYAGTVLYPADPELRKMYGKMGYTTCSTVTEFESAAGTPVNLRRLTAEEYTVLRRRYLPQEGLIQEGSSIAYLSAYAQFFAGEDFLLAAAVYQGIFHGMELLGNRDAAPGILAALGYEIGSFRCPGEDILFAMFCPLTPDAAAPGYVGLVFD